MQFVWLGLANINIKIMVTVDVMKLIINICCPASEIFYLIHQLIDLNFLNIPRYKT